VDCQSGVFDEDGLAELSVGDGGLAASTSRDWTSMSSTLAGVTSMPSMAAYSPALVGDPGDERDPVEHRRARPARLKQTVRISALE
jgi:hypothetical protein